MSTCHFLIGLCFPLAQVLAAGAFQSFPCSRETQIFKDVIKALQRDREGQSQKGSCNHYKHKIFLSPKFSRSNTKKNPKISRTLMCSSQLQNFPDQTQTKSSNQHHIISNITPSNKSKLEYEPKPLFINSDPNLQQSRPRIRTRLGTEEGTRAGFVLTRVDRTEQEQEKERSFPFSQRFHRSRVEVTVFSLIHPFLLSFSFSRNLHRRSRSFLWVFCENISRSIKRRRRGVGWYKFIFEKSKKKALKRRR